MLSFNGHQFEKMRAARVERLRQALFDEGRGEFQGRCAHLDDAALRGAIDRTIAAAEAAGIRSDPGVTLFFRVALHWGLAFLENPQIPWVLPIKRLRIERTDDWIARVHDIAFATLKTHGGRHARPG